MKHNKESFSLPIPLVPTLVCVAIGIFFWHYPPPQAVSLEGWRLLGIFIATILAIILKIMPIGAISIVAISIVAMTAVTSGGDPKQSVMNALSGFGNPLIWLIGISIIISRGIIKTGLGKRISYFFIMIFGKSTLGIAYALVVSETLLAPVTPSNTARGGGIIHPIMRSISSSFGSEPHKGTQGKMGKYLSLVNYQTNPITSTMFITATAPNPLVVNTIAKATDSNFYLSWGEWALAMLLPCLVALACMPLVLWVFFPPEIKDTRDAKEMAKTELSNMGPMSWQEKVMLGIFVIMLSLWAGVTQIFGFSINPTSVALLGLSLALLSGILTWEDCLKEKSAWDTVVWFSALIMMATFLSKLGVIGYMASLLQGFVASLGWSWFYSCLLLTVIYFYAHYFFASTTAHIAAMLGAFLTAGIALGAPIELYGLMLAAASSLMMSLTHYATGTAPVIFGSGHSSIGEWWKAGFIMSLSNFAVFLIVGGIWWKMLGYY